MESDGECVECGQPVKVSNCKDYAVCDVCYSALVELEMRTVRKLVHTPADHIIDNVYLGPQGSSINLEYLRQQKIDRVAATAKFVDHPFKNTGDGIEYLALDVDDSPSEDLKAHFDSVIAFIEKNKETNVLVHCVSGISRSGACVIAYVMKSRRLTYDQALELVRSRRAVVHPNSGFQAQLRLYQEELGIR
jgi:dual specificity phosphatase 12